MERRRRIFFLAVIAVIIALPVTVNAGMDCYPGTLIRTPEGYSQCEPFVGGECTYCEVIVQGP